MRRRFQFSLKQLLVATAVVALLLGIGMDYIRKAVDVREARQSDQIYEEYFGFDPGGMKPRNILVATGIFTTSTRLSGVLYLVQGGSVDVVNGWAVGRSTNRLGDGIWQRMEIAIALGENDTPTGRITNLGSAGHSRGGGHRGGQPHNVNVTSCLAVPGRITPGRNHIVYVEGDRPPNLDHDMSIEDFARKNRGNYLVVTLELD